MAKAESVVVVRAQNIREMTAVLAAVNEILSRLDDGQPIQPNDDTHRQLLEAALALTTLRYP